MSSIRVVIQTQYLENYGAHDWDGEGYAPQHWKPKGGSTYIVVASPAEIQCDKFWQSLQACIAHESEYSREYIISESIVDAIDFNESDHVEEWEEPIHVAMVDGNMHCLRERKDFLTLQPVGQQKWVQHPSGESTESSYEEYAA